MTFALLPAAGKSRRMGRPKLALPLGGRTVLECTIGVLREADVEHILVVLAPQGSDLQPLAERAGAHVLLLPEETPDMRATVEAGLRWLEDRFHPRPEDSWLLVPADHPALDAMVVRQLLQMARDDSAHSIVIPTFKGKRGHPALIRWKHVHAMKAWPAEQGINTYLRNQVGVTLELPVETEAVLWDVDVSDDYERVRRVFGE
jgi:molybdenum cofactor cytidylyltransferase